MAGMNAFHPTRRFEGVMIPKYDSMPNGPQQQSMARCTCGGWWKYHRLVDGACPRTAPDLGSAVDASETPLGVNPRSQS